jgi:hypothetical protein
MSSYWLFRMRNYAGYNVGVATDLEIEAPRAVDAGLPDVAGLVVLLGVQRRVVQVLEEKTELLFKGFLNRRRGLLERLQGPLGRTSFFTFGRA